MGNGLDRKGALQLPSAHQIVPNGISPVVRSIGHPKMASNGMCAI